MGDQEAETFQVRSFVASSSAFVKHRPKTETRFKQTMKPVKRTLGIGEAKRRRERSELLVLQRFMARPPGCAHLGSQATMIGGYLNSFMNHEIPIILDSGSNITLISTKALRNIKDPPRVRRGHNIRLSMVSGEVDVDQYVPLRLLFKTKDGPVQLGVEAYVVDQMSTPFILGNDFADQYGISLARSTGLTNIYFGRTGRFVPVHSSVGKIPDEYRNRDRVLNVTGVPNSQVLVPSLTPMERLRTIRQRRIEEKRDRHVRARQRCVIPPHSSRLIPVTASFPKGQRTILVEKIFNTSRNADDAYAPPDTLLDYDCMSLHVSNFSDLPAIVERGQALGLTRDPHTWLDNEQQYDKKNMIHVRAHRRLVQDLIKMNQSDAHSGQSSVSLVNAETPKLTTSGLHAAEMDDDTDATDALEGGPKTAEAPPDDVSSQELLQAVDISSELSPEQRQEVEKVLLQNQLAFSLDGRLGNTDARCTIPLRPGAKEMSLPPFPTSPAKREVINKQMDTWIKLDVIEPSISPWGAPGFITYRNGKPRMVIDYRKLNEMTIPDEFPLPKQEDIMNALSGSQWLSAMDALAGFTQVTIEEEDRPKTAFRTHRGLYQFRRMPFGLRNGPSIFQRIMQNVLAPYLWIFSLVYIDDIVIYSKTFDDHVKHLQLVLRAITDAKITLSPSKCHFAYRSLLLLGQKVSRLGLSTHKDKVDAIVQLAEPKNVTELYTFLGMMVYFSAYIPFYAWMAAPLFQLLRKGTRWTWEPVQQEAFDLCKQVLTQAPVRAHPIQGRPYRVYSDACDYGLAAILQQVQPILIKDLRGTRVYDRLERAYKCGEPIPVLVTDVNKAYSDVPAPGPWASNFEDTEVHIERVVAYWSRILKGPERNYSPTEREALALKEGLIKFQSLIEGERILAITDHAALTWARTFQNVNRRLLTWGAIFNAYPDLHIVHRAGRIHSNVDPISRLRRRVPYQDGPPNEDPPDLTLGSQINDPLKNAFDELGERFEERLLRVATKHSQVLTEEQLNREVPKTYTTNLPADQDDIYIPQVPGKGPMTYTTVTQTGLVVGLAPREYRKWRTAITQDRHFNTVLNAISAENDPSNPTFPQYFLGDDGLLYFDDWDGSPRLCVPEALRTEITSEAHNQKTESAHAGYHRTYNRIASTYYWPRMSRDIKRYVSTCDICPKTKPRRHAPTGLLRPIPIPARPFEVVSMDFIPELPKSNGYDNCLVIVDKLTKYGIFIPTQTTIDEKETAQLFFKHVVTHFGLPRQVITDRDARWRNSFWKQVCQHMNITRALTTAHHPQADGQTEILNQHIEIALRAYISPQLDDWSDHLDGLALSYNTTPHTATGYSPAYLLRGYQPTTVSNLMHNANAIPRPYLDSTSLTGGDREVPSSSIHAAADEMNEQFVADRQRAQQALRISQAFQQRNYNKGRLTLEFKEGDQVVINPHSLELLKHIKGRGKKLLMKYDGPFEVIEKISPVSYRLRLPRSYRIHPVINIAHLELYQQSAEDLGKRPSRRLQRADFDDLPEVEVERIVGERVRKGKSGRRIIQYRTRYSGFNSDHDEWLTQDELRNAPAILAEWQNAKKIRTTKNF